MIAVTVRDHDERRRRTREIRVIRRTDGLCAMRRRRLFGDDDAAVGSCQAKALRGRVTVLLTTKLEVWYCRAVWEEGSCCGEARQPWTRGNTTKGDSLQSYSVDHRLHKGLGDSRDRVLAGNLMGQDEALAKRPETFSREKNFNTTGTVSGSGPHLYCFFFLTPFPIGEVGS